MKRILSLLAAASMLAASSTGAMAQDVFPPVIPLPDGWGGEGIAVGRDTDFYVGGRQGGGPYQGAVYKGDLRPGKGAVLVQPDPTRCALGMKFDPRSNALFVGGGPTGAAYIYDADTGRQLAFFQFQTTQFPATPFTSFVNDVTIAPDAAYFTDSFKPLVYRVPLLADGTLPDPPVYEEIALTGDWVQGTGFSANGIAATPDGKSLIIANQRHLYRINPPSGHATRIELGAEMVGGDGILLDGNLCYSAAPFQNLIEVISLDATLTHGAILYTMTSPNFDIPTTIAPYGDSIYAVNARFTSGPPTTQTYSIARVDKPRFGPARIPLPNGFRPEGITVRPNGDFYVGSIPTGAIVKGSVHSGASSILVPAQDGRAAIGVKVDERSNLLYVAGGGTGSGFVYRADSGANVAVLPFANPADGPFVNDLVITGNAVFFTDSRRPFLYRVALLPNGDLSNPPEVTALPFSGDFVMQPPPAINANGIVATADGKWLVLVNMATATLFRVDPATGHTTRIDLGSESVPNGDGLILDGQTLYVCQNFRNQIAVVQLDSNFTSGTVLGRTADPRFRIPSTIAKLGGSIFAVNARFDTPADTTTQYDIVRIDTPVFLRIEPSVYLSWPGNTAGWILEAATNVKGPWQLVDANPVPVDGMNTVVVKTSATGDYFRLRKP